MDAATVVDLTRTFGQVLIATFIATAFWGMTCMQTLMYFVTYEEDNWLLKSLVASLLILDTVHEIICIQGLWVVLIPKFGDIVNTTIVHTPFALEPLFMGTVALLAQIFFTWRIWSFSNKNWIFPIALLPLTIGQFVVYVVDVAKKVGTSLTFAESQARNRKLILSATSMVAGTDAIIAVAMCVLLWQGRTGFVDSGRKFVRLMNASVSTGTCMAVFALLAVILAAIFPRDLFYVLGSIPLCPLYCNSVLANLNSRPSKTTKSMEVSVNFRNQDNSIAITSLSVPGFSIQTFDGSTSDEPERTDIESKPVINK